MLSYMAGNPLINGGFTGNINEQEMGNFPAMLDDWSLHLCDYLCFPVMFSVCV